MKIAFFSTMSGSLWGGSELLWFETARRCLQEGDDVYVSVPDERGAAQQLGDLRSFGATVNLWGGAADWSTRAVEDFKPGVICINQGGTYDGVEMFFAIDLDSFFSIHRTPFVLISQANFETEPWTDVRKMETSVHSRAAKTLFVSRNNRLMAERHLAHALDNAE